MTDRELLELAAKALGRKIKGYNRQRAGAEVAVLDDDSYWQPLHENGITDCDGDALRLFINLGMRISIYTGRMEPYTEVNDANEIYGYLIEESQMDGAAAATRRAIVRAAAEIGKAMP